MIPKSGNRFSDEIMLKGKIYMIPKSGNRFSDEIMLKRKIYMIPKSGNRFSDKHALGLDSRDHAQTKIQT